jgi:NTE family protein
LTSYIKLDGSAYVFWCESRILKVMEKFNMASNRASSSSSKKIDLALQGGGAHGAFTWGVLDRLLDEKSVEICGLSGTSAGAMNAAIMASGYAIGGRSGAQKALEDYWKTISDAAKFSPFQRSFLDRLMGHWTLDYSPTYAFADALGRVLSPYDMPTGGINPLKDVLDKAIDFKALNAGPIKVFICATNVRTGRGRVFRTHEINTNVLLASACLPTLFRAIEIEGDPYWDGGYSGNPSLVPLIKECESMDTLIIQINPYERKNTPKTAGEIVSRLNEISFNAVLIKELRMMALLRRATTTDEGEGGLWGAQRVHLLTSDIMLDLGYTSKLCAEWEFLTMLRDEGRKTADQFLEKHYSDLGRMSTYEVEKLLEGI